MISIILAVLLVLLWIYHRRTVGRLRAEIEARAKMLFEEWSRNVLEAERRRIESELRKTLESEYKLALQRWLQEKEREIRRDAIKRSVSTILGRVGEYIAPFIAAADIGADPRDFRFIGSPIDYIVFKGLSRGKPEEIVFVEVKTGRSARLTERERAVRDLVRERRVSWRMVNLHKMVEDIVREVEKEAERLAEEQAQKRGAEGEAAEAA